MQAHLATTGESPRQLRRAALAERMHEGLVIEHKEIAVSRQNCCKLAALLAKLVIHVTGDHACAG